MEWTQYRRKGVSEMRPYLPGEDLTGISVSKTDQPPVPGGMIARNPQNHADQWYVAPQYFQDNFEEVARGSSGGRGLPLTRAGWQSRDAAPPNLLTYSPWLKPGVSRKGKSDDDRADDRAYW